MSIESKTFNLPLKIDYVLHNPQSTTEVFVLLHGYMETGVTTFEKLKDSLPAEAAIISPSGPFPIPRKIGNVYEPRYAHYYYDIKTQVFFRERDTMIAAIKEILKEHNLNSLPATVIGFSQGGYLAPFVALELDNAKATIGIGSEYREELQNMGLTFSVHSIHGKKDDVVNFDHAKDKHQQLLDCGRKGSFVELANTAHEITEEVATSVKELVN